MFDAAVDGSVLNLANNLSYKGNFKDMERSHEHSRENAPSTRPPLPRNHYLTVFRSLLFFSGRCFILCHFCFKERRDSGGLRRDERTLHPEHENEERLSFRPLRRGRSRSPRDYHEPKRRREEMGRYCIELTNLPFRVTELEIRQ